MTRKEKDKLWELVRSYERIAEKYEIALDVETRLGDKERIGWFQGAIFGLRGAKADLDYLIRNDEIEITPWEE